MFLEIQSVSDTYTSSPGRTVSFVVLNTVVTVQGEVIPADSQMGADIKSLVCIVLEPRIISEFRLNDYTSEFYRFLEIVVTA